MKNDMNIVKSLIELVKALKGFSPMVQIAICFGILFLVGYESHLNHDIFIATIGIVNEWCRMIETIILHLFIFFLLWRRSPLRRSVYLLPRAVFV